MKMIVQFSWRDLFPSWQSIAVSVWKWFLKILWAYINKTDPLSFAASFGDKEWEFKKFPRFQQTYRIYRSGIFYHKDHGWFLSLKIPFVKDNKITLAYFIFYTNQFKFPPSDLSKESYPNQQLRDLAEDLKKFASARNWYRKKNIKHRIGIVLYGPPGGGKTQFTKDVRNAINGISYYVEIHEKGILPRSEAGIGLLPLTRWDDMDRLYHKDQYVGGRDGPSFDTVLKFLDNLDGIVVLTVNDITKLDPAIAQVTEDGRISRPGRIDRIVYVGPTDEQGRRECAQRILSEWPEHIERLVHQGEGETIAQFQDRCKTLAVELYWRDKGGQK